MNRDKHQQYFFLFVSAALYIFLFIMCGGLIITGTSAGNDDRESTVSSASGLFFEVSGEQYWHLSRVMAPQAWAVTEGREDTVIAVLDTGIDANHPALAEKVIAKANFTSSPVASDCNGHGTHIAGIIAGGTNQLGGATGLAYRCRLINVKVANDDGSVQIEAVVKGILWAVDNGANIINISLAIGQPSVALEEAVQYAWQCGAIVVAAAGNSYQPRLVYPATYPCTIAVAATDKQDDTAPWSNRGEWVDVSAPGAAIWSSTPANKWAYKNGTSMAAALVSGEAALLFPLAADINGDGKVNDEVRRAIENSCDEISDKQGKNRVINVFKAIELLSHDHCGILSNTPLD
ncbi:MAG: S8 family serine peptidase [Dehalococcoidales bacterium]|nr:S8 family serine peptidase [Dehalococcoidales bacterium]